MSFYKIPVILCVFQVNQNIFSMHILLEKLFWITQNFNVKIHSYFLEGCSMQQIFQILPARLFCYHSVLQPSENNLQISTIHTSQRCERCCCKIYPWGHFGGKCQEYMKVHLDVLTSYTRIQNEFHRQHGCLWLYCPGVWSTFLLVWYHHSVNFYCFLRI